MKTPLRYVGGKSKAYEKITSQFSNPLFHQTPTRIISPFIGGGSLECRWASELDIEVYGYDVFDALVNFWQILREKPQELSERLSLLEPTAEKYNEIKEKLMCWDYTQEMLKDWTTDHYKRDPIELDSLTAATFYYFNHNLSFGPQYLGWISKIYVDNPSKWERCIERIRDFSIPKLKVEKGSCFDVIPAYQNDFLYLDPPYYLQKDSDNKMFKGLYPNPNIDVHHSGFDHELLRDQLHSHKGRFILSYNNCETIREYYKDFRQEFPTWSYSYSNGETRIGKNKKETGNVPKECHEILIIKD